MTVSYTHLDVYKRQDMYSAGDIIEYEGGGRDYLVSIEGEEGLWGNAGNPSWVERGLRGFCDECHPFFADCLYAVSYTHLDVYKRQAAS